MDITSISSDKNIKNSGSQLLDTEDIIRKQLSTLLGV